MSSRGPTLGSSMLDVLTPVRRASWPCGTTPATRYLYTVKLAGDRMRSITRGLAGLLLTCQQSPILRPGQGYCSRQEEAIVPESNQIAGAGRNLLIDVQGSNVLLAWPGVCRRPCL
jgi:hypothetical protein